MVFPVKVKRQALDRQSKNDGYGSWCACCGTSLNRKKKQAVARISLSGNGRKNANNCVIVCTDCYTNIANTGETKIPAEVLPYSKTAPPNWETEKRK